MNGWAISREPTAFPVRVRLALVSDQASLRLVAEKRLADRPGATTG